MGRGRAMARRCREGRSHGQRLLVASGLAGALVEACLPMASTRTGSYRLRVAAMGVVMFPVVRHEEGPIGTWDLSHWLGWVAFTVVFGSVLAHGYRCG